jgi:hypothetical protein
MMSVRHYLRINLPQVSDVEHWKHMLKNVKNIIFIFNGDHKSAVVCHSLIFLISLPFVLFLFKAKDCPSRNMIYSDCVSACPRTCHNPTLSITQCHTQSSACTSGCVCSNETVYDSFQDECIQLEKCTCQYNNIQYQPGDHVSMDCNDW